MKATTTMKPPAIRNARFQVAGSLAFQVAMTVPLITRLTSTPRAPISAAAFTVRLLPKVSGMTATFVSPKTTLAVLTSTMSRTSGQNPRTRVYDHVHTPMMSRPAAMYGARRPAAERVRSLARPSRG